MNRRSFLRVTAMGAAGLMPPRWARAQDPAAKTPNIVLILADDLGYNDLSCQGAVKVGTPGIDRIAREGVRFTDAHTPAALCCPTRYGVLTGRYPWRKDQTCWASPGAALLIEPGRMTIASLLKEAGYTTGCVGKWHLGFGIKEHPVDWNGELKPGPLEVGFDYFFGDVSNRWGVYVENHAIPASNPNDPIRFENRKRVSGDSAFTMKHEENARVLHEKATAFIEQNRTKPFFLYYAPNNIHVPLTPNPRFVGSSQCGKYGDFIRELDWTVGEVLATLDRLGLTQNTLVIFTSDNGGHYDRDALIAGHRCNAPLNGQKGDVWEGGSRVPFLARWPGRIPAGTQSNRLLCLTDMLATFASLMGRKLPDDAGPDSYNALPLILGQPATADARTNLIMQSSAASIAIKKRIGPDDLWAVREENWKLVLGQKAGYTTRAEHKKGACGFKELGLANSDFTADGKLKPDAPPEQLYDLAADPGETRNLYRERPDIVERLTKLFERLRDAGRSRTP
ncbi:MAG: arylsulfatase [Planctomycetota bacterium]